MKKDDMGDLDMIRLDAWVRAISGRSVAVTRDVDSDGAAFWEIRATLETGNVIEVQAPSLAHVANTFWTLTEHSR